MVDDVDELDPSVDDPFRIVGVPRDATRDEIKRAYRRRARNIHPDVSDDPDATRQFRRLVVAFETLMDESRAATFETQRKRSSARSRAQRQWDDMYSGSGSRGSQSASYTDRPAGSRREAEQRTREESEKRRRRWREMAFEEVWREHMPLDYEATRSQFQRVDFVAALEVAVQAFVRERKGTSTSAQARDSSSRADEDPEQPETEELLKLNNREVLRSELSDARHRSAKHRDRVRWLESELNLANKKAEMWRGAAPATESDRIQALERELAFLELANRYRSRLGEQRIALQRLKAREKALTQRLATLDAST